MDTGAFLAATLRNQVNEAIAGELFRLALPDAWIVSGCLVQAAWNVHTTRAADYGINDYVRPNPGPNFSAANYGAKARRWKMLWPELTVPPTDAI